VKNLDGSIESYCSYVDFISDGGSLLSIKLCCWIPKIVQE
jgi:hypothetical protein